MSSQSLEGRMLSQPLVRKASSQPLVGRMSSQPWWVGRHHSHWWVGRHHSHWWVGRYHSHWWILSAIGGCHCYHNRWWVSPVIRECLHCITAVGVSLQPFKINRSQFLRIIVITVKTVLFGVRLVFDIWREYCHNVRDRKLCQ